MRETALAVAAARLGGIGPDILHDAGMAGEEIHEILISAIDAVADALGPDLAEPLRDRSGPASATTWPTPPSSSIGSPASPGPAPPGRATPGSSSNRPRTTPSTAR